MRKKLEEENVMLWNVKHCVDNEFKHKQMRQNVKQFADNESKHKQMRQNVKQSVDNEFKHKPMRQNVKPGTSILSTFGEVRKQTYSSTNVFEKSGTIINIIIK